MCGPQSFLCRTDKFLLLPSIEPRSFIHQESSPYIEIFHPTLRTNNILLLLLGYFLSQFVDLAKLLAEKLKQRPDMESTVVAAGWCCGTA